MTALVPHPNVVARTAGDTVVLVNLDTNRILTLNRTGSRIWELIVAGHDVDSIEKALCAQYDIEPDRVRQQLSSLVEQLLQEGLVLAQPAQA